MPDFRKQQLCWVDRVSVAQNVHRVWSVRLWVPLLSLWTEQEAVGGSQVPWTSWARSLGHAARLGAEPSAHSSE